VPVTTLPTNVNKDAKSEPYQTNLTLQCAAQPQSLDNFDFPNSLDFVWEPATCDDVTLTIFFREATLVKSWPGEWGFRDFLQDFRAGRKIYAPDDFPQHKSILEGLGIQRIQVNYTIKNFEPVLGIKQYPALRVPSQAAYCWAGLGAGGLHVDIPATPAPATAVPQNQTRTPPQDNAPSPSPTPANGATP